MIKRIIAPVQAWVLLHGKCVGCGQSLGLGKKVERQNNTQKVTCSCSRIYIFDKRKGKYHRAAFKEVNNG